MALENRFAPPLVNCVCLLVLYAACAVELQQEPYDHYDDNKLVFRMDNIEDLEELQHLVTFVDPERGLCPLIHPMEPFFEGPEILEPYGEAQLTELQSAYGDVLPQLRAEWVRRGGAAALDRLLFPLEPNDTEEEEEAPDDADTVHLSASPGSEGAFDLGALAQQLNGNGVDADLASMLHGLKVHISLDGSTVSFNDGTLMDLASSGDGDPNTPLVLDLNEILVSRERKKYMEGANARWEANSKDPRRRTETISEQLDAVEAQQAVADFEVANRAWLLAQKKTQPRSPVEADAPVDLSIGRATSATGLEWLRIRNVVAAAEHSCAFAEQSNGYDGQCTEDVLVLMSLVDGQLAALPLHIGGSDLRAELSSRVEDVAAAANRRIHERTAASANLCRTLHHAQASFVAGYEGTRFTAVLDTLLPILEAGVPDNRASDTTGDAPDVTDGNDAATGGVRTALDGLSTFVEHWRLDVCPAGTAVSAPELRAELWYTAALVRLVAQQRLEPFGGGSYLDALAFLNMLQASHLGSTNARLALGTMQEFGYVAQQDCWSAVGALVGVARAASMHMIAVLEDVYLHSDDRHQDAKTQEADGGTSRGHHSSMLHSARRFFRADHVQFTIFNQDQSTTTRRTLEEVHVALQERFTTSKSTYAAYQLLSVVRSLFWGSHKVAMQSSTTANDNTDAQLLHCWTWVIAARYAPHAVARFRSSVSLKCAVPFPDTYALFKNELHDATTQQWNTMDAAPFVAWKDAWVQQSTLDIHLYLVTVDSLTLLSLQEVLLPHTLSQDQLGVAQHDALERSKHLQTVVVELAERMHADGSTMIESMDRSRLQSAASREAVLSELDWHASLCLLSRIELQDADADDDMQSTTRPDPLSGRLQLGGKMGAASSGFLRSELFFVRGLVEHLRGDDVAAVEWLLRGAALEVEESDGPIRLLLGRLIAGPLDGTTSGRRGDCLFLLAHLLRRNESLFDALRVAGDDGLVSDVPGISMFRYHSGQSYSDALIAAASASPIHHLPSIVEGAFRKWASSQLLRQAPQSGVGEGSPFAECPAVLADLRNAMQLVHEHRQLQVVQWLSDRMVEWHLPKRWVTLLVDAVSSSMCSVVGPLVGIDCSVWFERDARPPVASGRTMHVLSRFRKCLNNWTNGFGASNDVADRAGATVLDVVASMELLSFWLQQGSSEALASILELSFVPSSDRAHRSHMRSLALSLTHLVSPDVPHIINEQAAIYQIPFHRRDDDGSNKRHALAQDLPFLLSPAESRLEAAHAAAYSAGIAYFQEACHHMSPADAFVCGMPDDGHSLLSVLRLERSAHTDRFHQWKRRYLANVGTKEVEVDSGAVAEGRPAVLHHLQLSMSAFASCSGAVVYDWFRSGGWDDGGDISALKHLLADTTGRATAGLLAASPRCMIALATMLTSYGFPAAVVQDVDAVDLPWRRIAEVTEVLMDVAIVTSERLSLFHRYTLSPEELQEAAVQSFASENGDDVDATESSDEDPDDTRLQESSLAKMHDRAMSKRSKHQAVAEWFSIKPIAHIDPSRIPDTGEGQWIVMRRMNIVASYYAAWWYKHVAHWLWPW